jgi:hypothetical protein
LSLLGSAVGNGLQASEKGGSIYVIHQVVISQRVAT